MNLLARFKPAQPVANDTEELPIRRRTFSATQFRDEELARAAEKRAVVEAAEQAQRDAAELARQHRLQDLDEERAAEIEMSFGKNRSRLGCSGRG